MSGACPNCAVAVEFRKNETHRKCPKCGAEIEKVLEHDQTLYRIVGAE